MGVPFVDLGAETQFCRAEIDAALRAVIDASAFIGGDAVRAFAEAMARHQEVEEVVPVGCGTDALQLTLQAFGVGPGDEVITTPCTAMPTAEAVSLTGATPVFADLAPGSWTPGPDEVAACLTPRTRALLPVHLYGIPCDLDAWRALADAHGLVLIEDCAQAQGARWRGGRVGNVGDAACFSFFPGKNLGGFGDGGAMTARDPEVRRRVRMLANHGREGKFDHVLVGTNSRLDAVQAAVLSAKLPHLDARNALRRTAAGWYRECLAGLDGVGLPAVPDPAEPVWHLYPVRVADRDGCRAFLKDRGIATGLHYPKPLHLQGAYANLGLGPGGLPRAEAAFAEELSLPMFPAIRREQVAEVAAALRAWLQETSAEAPPLSGEAAV
ncbi:MAG: DegT/DnrJ/EryC1/StrS family aminotransferase [Planctomycetota bacterium]